VTAAAEAAAKRAAEEKATAFVPGVGLFVDGELLLRDGEAVYVPGEGVLVEGVFAYVEGTPGEAAPEAAAQTDSYIPLISAAQRDARALELAGGELSVFNPATGEYETRDAASILAGEEESGAEDALLQAEADDLRVGGGIGRMVTPTRQSGFVLVTILVLLAGAFLLILYARLAHRRGRR
jgi:hypothetical protein